MEKSRELESGVQKEGTFIINLIHLLKKAAMTSDKHGNPDIIHLDFRKVRDTVSLRDS